MLFRSYGLEKPVRKPVFEKLLLADKVELAGYGEPGEGNILPALVLGQENKSTVPGQVPQPAYFEPEKWKQEQSQDKLYGRIGCGASFYRRVLLFTYFSAIHTIFSGVYAAL